MPRRAPARAARGAPGDKTAHPKCALVPLVPARAPPSAPAPVPAQSVPSLPGMMHSHFIRFALPSAFCSGRATKPKGWSLRHDLRSARGDVSEEKSRPQQSSSTSRPASYRRETPPRRAARGVPKLPRPTSTSVCASAFLVQGRLPRPGAPSSSKGAFLVQGRLPRPGAPQSGTQRKPLPLAHHTSIPSISDGDCAAETAPSEAEGA